MEIIDNLLSSYPDVLTTKDLMEILQIKKTYVYKILYISSDIEASTPESCNKIKAFKCGKNYRILKSEVIKYLKRQ